MAKFSGPSRHPPAIFTSRILQWVFGIHERSHSSRYRWRTVKVGGRRCAAWLKAKNDQENIRLVETRNYVPPQTAFYAHWLLFEKEAAFVGP